MIQLISYTIVVCIYYYYIIFANGQKTFDTVEALMIDNAFSQTVTSLSSVTLINYSVELIKTKCKFEKRLTILFYGL